jgi:hypothetical protein
MKEMDYGWFTIHSDGSLGELQPGHNLQDTNLVAVPNERREATPLAIAVGPVKAHSEIADAC